MDALRNSPPIREIAVAGNFTDTIRHMAAELPGLVVVDLELPGLGGLAGLVELVTQSGRARVVALADGHPPAIHLQARICGVAGLIDKADDKDRIHRTIGMVLRGGLGFPDTMAVPYAPATAPQVVLTTKQLRVLALLMRGKSNKQIAKDLELSPNTVKAHVSEIFRRLGVSTRAEAIVLAHEPLSPRSAMPLYQ